MAFEEVTKNSGGERRPAELAVYPGGDNCRLSVAACRQYLPSGTERANLHIDREERALGIEPDADGRYTLSTAGQARNVSCKTALRHLGLDPRDLSETVYCPVAAREVDGEAWVIVDVTPLDDALADGTPDTRFGPAHHDVEAEEDERERPAVFRAAQECDTITELADALGCSPDEARTRAMDEGVYSDLTDRPAEGGYGRPGGERA